MPNLRSTAGEFTPDSLIPDTSFPVQTGGVKLAKGQGVLLRGTVVGKNTDGVFVPANSASSIAPYGVLADDVDTGGEDATTDIVAVVYVSGPFNREALIFGGSDTATTHEETLREKGIYLKAVL
ncbi:head decoration protein [Lysinibacillus sp. NPDC047702]|uniref:head decoration protein n=1 Tax=unclassified Lysinibacillus TaxID=2636778 RepID=UPI003CFF025F